MGTLGLFRIRFIKQFALIGCAGVLLAGSCLAEDETVHFKFAPTDGTQYISNTKNTIAISQSDSDAKIISTAQRGLIRIKKDLDSYIITDKILSVKSEGLGPNYESAIMKIGEASHRVYLDGTTKKKIFSKKKIISTENETNISPDQTLQLMNFLSQKEYEKGNNIQTILNGKTLKMDSSFTVMNTTILPLGPIQHPVEYYLANKIMDGPDKGCVRLTYFNHNPTAAQKKQFVRDAAVVSHILLDESTFRIYNISLSGGGEVILDPSTLLVHSYSNEDRAILYGKTLNRIDSAVNLTMNESIENDFQAQ